MAHMSAPVAHLGSHDPMLIATNPHAFAHMFREHLASLTFNSKPIITNLTIIAHEHVHRMANVVAKCLDDHILQSHPSIRLPALYVLDSISKNVGVPYTSLWGERIIPIFLETYRLVDQPTKMRMEELLATWKMAGPEGRPLFGENAQWTIERSLFGSQGMPVKSTPPLHGVGSPMPHGYGAQSADGGKAKAIESIDRLLALGSKDLRQEPHNGAIQERMDSLRQLKQVLLTAALSPDEMNQIHAQLDALTAASNKNGSAPPPPQPPAHVHSPPAPTPALPASLSSALASLGNLSALTSGNNTPLGGMNAPPQQPPAAPAPGAGDPHAASALIASLMQAGLLGGGGAAAAAVEVDQDDAYIQSIMSLDIHISGPGFAKEPPALELVLHKHLPLQCRQCANRYPQGDKGKKGMDEHLDWHFTQNRRAKDYAVRGQSRSWFDKLENFIRGGFDDAAPSSKEGGGHGDDVARASGLTAAQEKALKEKFANTFVAAPTDPEIASKPCPICKETFKSQWSEDEEEWIWLNAIEVEGVYYHASCHYSAKALSDSVIRKGTSPPNGSARLSAGLQRGASRSATPHNQQRTASSGSQLQRLKGEEGIISIPANAPNGSPDSRKRKASLSENEEEMPSKKAAAVAAVTAA